MEFYFLPRSEKIELIGLFNKAIRYAATEPAFRSADAIWSGGTFRVLASELSDKLQIVAIDASGNVVGRFEGVLSEERWAVQEEAIFVA